MSCFGDIVLEGDCRYCLGLHDGILADCPTKSCVSSQDDTPAVWQPPWEYEDGTWEEWKQKLVSVLTSKYGDSLATVKDEGRYVRFELTSPDAAAVDDIEFYFTPGDDTVQFRGNRRSGNDRGANQKRMEELRISLKLQKLPVLRNRARALIFFESPWDKFGPSADPELSPEESAQGDLYAPKGDTDPKAPPFQTPSQRALDILRSESDDRVRSK